MLSPKHSGFLMLCLCAIALVSCREKEPYHPDLTLTADTDSASTLKVFNFKVALMNDLPANELLYIRWDWNGDSIWDTPYSVGLERQHRFHAPGTYEVRIEALTKNQVKSLINKKIVVYRGYSPPFPDFEINPKDGNFKTNLTFDATKTRDDEDSLSQLRFRWDFHNNGTWDTPYSSSPVTNHVFTEVGFYNIELEVIDPRGLISTIVKSTSINNVDPSMQIKLIWDPLYPEEGDTVYFMASVITDSMPILRSIRFSWSFEGGAFSPSGTRPEYSYVFRQSGLRQVGVQVIDNEHLTNQMKFEVPVGPKNLPPVPVITISSHVGNLGTQFYYDAWKTTDDQNSPSEIMTRWDFEGDGIWDTPFSYEKTCMHQYSSAGNFQVTLEARDTLGLKATTSIKIKVTSFSNQTGYIFDKRDNQYYGTVKIGSQWWMSENLNFRVHDKNDYPLLFQCYVEAKCNCDQYGTLYLADEALRYLGRGRELCPTGWHVPTREEMLVLQKNLPSVGGREALLVGGSTDFNGNYSGFGRYEFVTEGMSTTIVDTLYLFYKMNHEGYYLTTTRHPYTDGRNDVFTLRLRDDYYKPDFEYNLNNQYYSIRCIKDN